MKELFATPSPRRRKLLCLAACGALAVLVLAGLPFFVDVVIRSIDWFPGPFLHSNRLSEEAPWLH